MHPLNQPSSPFDWRLNTADKARQVRRHAIEPAGSVEQCPCSEQRPSLTWDDLVAQTEQRAGTPQRATGNMSKIDVSPLILPDDLPRLPAQNACPPGAATLVNSRHERFARLVASWALLSDAYRKVYGRSGMSARVGGSRLHARADVRQRVIYLTEERAYASNQKFPPKCVTEMHC